MNFILCIIQFTLAASALAATGEVTLERLENSDNRTKTKLYDGAQLLKIVKTNLTIDLIEREGLDVWAENMAGLDVMVMKDKLEEIIANLNSMGIHYSVAIPNIQEIIDREAMELSPNRTKMRSLDEAPIDFNVFNRLDDIYDYMAYLQDKYPDNVRVNTIGYTVEKRPIKSLMISFGLPNANMVVIDAGIHAREWLAPSTAVFIINELVENRERLSSQMKSLDFYIIPVLNPDGYEFSHTINRMWRKNRSGTGMCRGVDLNRNFDIHFGYAGTSGFPCTDIYRGETGNSELETKAFVRTMRSLGNRIVAYITFHSYGQYILIPYGHRKNAFAPHFEEMEKVGFKAADTIKRLYGKEYTVGNTANTLYPAAGGSDDWTKSEIGVFYTYTIELRDKGYYGFISPSKEIYPTAIEAFAAVTVISEAASEL